MDLIKPHTKTDSQIRSQRLPICPVHTIPTTPHIVLKVRWLVLN